MTDQELVTIAREMGSDMQRLMAGLQTGNPEQAMPACVRLMMGLGMLAMEIQERWPMQ